MPRVLELFQGTGSIGAAFERIGWEVISVDIVAAFNPTHIADIADFDYKKYAPEFFRFSAGKSAMYTIQYRKNHRWPTRHSRSLCTCQAYFRDV